VIGLAGTARRWPRVKLGLVRATTRRRDRARIARARSPSARAPARRHGRRAHGDPGIEPQRVDVIAAGAAIFVRIIQRIDAPV
jgi:hypothetical protein